MTEVRGELPVLIALGTREAGRRWALEGEAFLIGRGADCDLVVPDRRVSRHHARIRREPGGFVVEDLGSRNGTHVNGRGVEGPTLLQDGDVIQVALALELAFVGSEGTLPLGLSDQALEAARRLRMDAAAHRVWLREAELDPPLSPPQYRLLEILYRDPERVVTREQIVRHVWPGEAGEGISEQAIDALVRRLRERLAEADPSHPYILTVRGLGFRLSNPPGGGAESNGAP